MRRKLREHISPPIRLSSINVCMVAKRFQLLENVSAINVGELSALEASLSYQPDLLDLPQ